MTDHKLYLTQWQSIYNPILLLSLFKDFENTESNSGKSESLCKITLQKCHT